MISFNEEEKKFMKEHHIDEEKLQIDKDEKNKLEQYMLDLIDEPEGEIADDIMNKLYMDWLNKHLEIRKQCLGY